MRGSRETSTATALVLAAALVFPNQSVADNGSKPGDVEAPASDVHADGSMRWSYDMRGGMPDGESVVRHVDGTLLQSGTFVTGLRHGLFRYYSRTGELLERALYVNGERRWRSNKPEAEEAAPLQLLAEKRHHEGAYENASKGRIEEWKVPYVPFVSMDRITGRFGAAGGVSSDEADINGMRGELFAHLILGRMGVYASASQTLVRGRKNARDDESYATEQATLEGALSYQLLPSFEDSLVVRVGYLRSFDSESDDGIDVSGINRTQRPADLAASYVDATAPRVSASYLGRHQGLIMQIDTGVDRLNARRGMNLTPEPSTLLRLNGAVGFGNTKWQLAVESINTVHIGGPSLSTLGLSANYITDSIHWWAANTTRDQDGEFGVILTMGSWFSRLDE